MPYNIGGNGGGGAGGAKTLPPLDALSLLVWDFQRLLSGATPTIGQSPGGDPYLSTGTNALTLSTGFSNGQGGAIAMVGPGGAGLVYAADFYSDGAGNNGALATIGAPPCPANNTSQTVSVYALVKSLVTSAQGVIFSKAFFPASWTAPYNAIEINFKAGNAGFIEFGMTDTAAPGGEIGTDTSDQPRDAVTIGYHCFHHVIDQAAKRGILYIDGYARKSYPFTGGISNGTGPYMIGGNTVNAADSSNLRYSRVSVDTVARSPAYIASAAKAFLTS